MFRERKERTRREMEFGGRVLLMTGMGAGWYCSQDMRRKYGFLSPRCLRLEGEVVRRGDVSSPESASLDLMASGGVTVPSMVLLDDDHASSTLSSPSPFFLRPSASLRLLLAETTFSPQCHALNTIKITTSTTLYDAKKSLENKIASTSFRNCGSCPGSSGLPRPGPSVMDSHGGEVDAVAVRENFRMACAQGRGTESIEGIMMVEEEEGDRERCRQ